MVIILPVYDFHSYVYFRFAEVASAFVEGTQMAHWWAHSSFPAFLLKMKYNDNGLEYTLFLKQKSECESIPVDFVQVMSNG